MMKSDAEWRESLTPEQYRVLRGKGTEPAFAGAYWDHSEEGTYLCAGCGLELFASAQKFDSGTGWPSFWRPVAPDRVGIETDLSHGMRRTEVHCARCGTWGTSSTTGPSRPAALLHQLGLAPLRTRGGPALSRSGRARLSPRLG